MLDQAPVEAEVSAATGTKPIDWEAVANAMHIFEQALAAASLAHVTMLNLLGLSEQSEPILPVTQQAV